MADFKTCLKDARAAEKSGDNKAAERLAKAALEFDPVSYDALTCLGKATQGLGSFEASEAAFRKGTEVAKDRTACWNGLAEVYNSTEKLELLIDALKVLITLSASDRAKANDYRDRLAAAEKKLAGPEPETKTRAVEKKPARKTSSKRTVDSARTAERKRKEQEDAFLWGGAQVEGGVTASAPSAAKPPVPEPGLKVKSAGGIKVKSAGAHKPDEAAEAPKVALEKFASADISPTLAAQKAQVQVLVEGLAAAHQGALKGVVEALEQQVAVKNKKADPPLREQALLGFELLCDMHGALFEPYMPQVLPIVISCLGDGRVTVAPTAKGVLTTLFARMNPEGMRVMMPFVLAGLEDRQFKTKEAMLELMQPISATFPIQVGATMPELFPILMECLADTHPKVSGAALAVLPKTLAATVGHPETKKLMKSLLLAITSPAAETAPCLDHLMETTFVNAVDRSTLSLLLPVIVRGLREPSADLNKKAAITCGNICALVMDPRDMVPFVPVLFPPLFKAKEHSHPDVRAAAARGSASLLEGAGFKDDDPYLATLTKSHSNSALNQMAKSPALSMDPARMFLFGSLKSSIPEEERAAYVADLTAASILGARGLDIEGIVKMLVELTTPYLHDLPAEKIVELMGGALKNSNVRFEESQDIEEADYVVRLEKIILAFAGRVLLRQANLLLKTGHVYGLVGQNGMGKTTLLNRVAAGDIQGFPKDVRVYYIQHEILSEKELPLVEFMKNQVPPGTSEKTIMDAMTDVGFTETLLSKTVAELSGGWRMKLAIARSMMWKANLLLLDEPTNHLDESSVKWLADHVNSLKGNTTVCMVSHDYDFFANTITDETGETASTSEAPNGDGEAPAAAPEGGPTHEIKPMKFPDPGRLEGVVGKRKAVLRLTHASFKYETSATPILTDVTATLCLGSRVAMVGLNGAGKTTLMKLLVGEMEPDEGVGEVWKHHNLRLAYIAQHSMHHLEQSIENTPLQYIQNRFYDGRDKELSRMQTMHITPEDKELMKERGNIYEIIGRQERGKALWYETRKIGRKEDDTSWEPLEYIQKMEPYVLKLAKNYDEEMKAQQSGMKIRPLTSIEVRNHLGDFGIDADLADGKIKRMSGGQRSRLVLAAAMWSKPHLIALDEPTNYLDNDTLAALTHALSSFKGGVMTISHNAAFVNQLCTEEWKVEGGVVHMRPLGEAAIKEAEKLAKKLAKTEKKK
eukprot:gene13308-15726_t